MASDCPAKAVSGWSSVFGWLVLAWCLPLAAIALGQSDTNHSSTGQSSSAHAITSKTTAGNSEKPSTTSSKSTSSSAKTHSASRSSAYSSSATHRKPNSVASSRSPKGKRSRSRKTARGQQKIDPERAHEIQEALIREHYLTGEPTGKWDQASEDALRRYQADRGWQSKTVPDSRALISLGLGPSHDHLLNPESAMTTGPEASHSASAKTESPTPGSHSADPAPASTSPVPAADPPQPNSSQPDASIPQK